MAAACVEGGQLARGRPLPPPPRILAKQALVGAIGEVMRRPALAASAFVATALMFALPAGADKTEAGPQRGSSSLDEGVALTGADADRPARRVRAAIDGDGRRSHFFRAEPRSALVVDFIAGAALLHQRQEG
eukprot:351557-Chlamydomonas_euryale.AAC.4